MRTKQTERKTQKGLPRATFGSSLQKQRSGTTGVLKVKIGKPRRNRIPSDDEEAPACWSDISPSIPSSPEVEQLVDKVNEGYTASMAADTPPPLAGPRVPTAAVKCPRKEFRGATQRPKEHKEPRKPKASKIRLTALQEIRRYQSSFEDVLPFAPFIRLVRELCNGLRAMRFTKEALQALRSWSGGLST